MAKLRNKIALITGGTTGIGAATAKLFQTEGAKVIVTGQDSARLAAVAKRLPGVDAQRSSQGDVGASRALIERIGKEYGRIDVLFVNAGVAQFAPIEAVDEDFFDKQFAVNVRGAYFLIKYAVPLIPDGGAIILTGSTAASLGAAGMTVYAATKAALRSFGRTLAGELASRNIRVNTVSPGPTQTDIFGKAGLNSAQIADFMKNAEARIPLKRIGSPEEIAATALYLAADATFVTGAEIVVGGGLVYI